MALDKPTFDRIVALLLPLMNDPNSRKEFVESALYGCPVLNQIEWGGAGQTFTVALIRKLIDYGEWTPGRPALAALLEDVLGQVGADKQDEIEDLLSSINSPSPSLVREEIVLPSPTSSPRSHDHIFISYAHADRALVERLANDLRDRGYTVWIDFEGIRGGDVWKQSIADGIYASAIVLVMVSPDAVQSEWVGIEIKTALNAGKKLIPLRVRPLTTPNDVATAEWLGIDHLQYRDFTLGYDTAFQELLKDLPKPSAGIPLHCRKLAARLAALPWGLDHYIQEEAKLLPINASPYQEGGVLGQRENLLLRLKRGSRLIVLGEPGIGKTVAVERLAWEYATGEPLIVPVLIKLLEYTGEPLVEWIRLKLIETGEISLKRDQISDYLNSMAYECCVLLDGLNEVRPQYRDAIVREITQFALEYPRHRLIVTSRIQDESWRRLHQGTAIHETVVVQPIAAEDAQKYLSAHLGEADSTGLWRGLDKRLRDLALTPLLLWLIKEAYLKAKAAAQGGAIRLPDNRGALYRDFVDRLLERLDERDLSRKIPKHERVAALEVLALHLHRQQALTLSRDEAEQIVGSEGMIEALLGNGLLTGDSALRFAPHQTVQEHFAARAIEDGVLKAAKGGRWTKLAHHLGLNLGTLEYAREPWWWETFIQLAGLTAEGNALALALADINPWLAWWCFEEGGKFDKEIRAKIGNRSQVLVYSTNVNDRRSALNALIRLPTPRVIEYLAHLSVDKDSGISRTALQALINLGEDGIVEFCEQFPVRIETLSSTERAAWGRAMHDLDPRQGVGLRKDGLPDLDWVDIPAGEFIYGEDNAQKRLKLPRFAITRYLVTHEQFGTFLTAADGFSNPVWWAGMAADDDHKAQPGEQRFKVGNHPRENVSWFDAVAFTRWLSAKLGYAVTLPTEQQYERAARWTDGHLYPYGNKFDDAHGNTGETGIRQTSAVGIFPDGASVEGIHDLSGNVWEWCLNEYSNPERIETTGSERRVLRGGSWDFSQVNARAVVRFNYDPLARHFNSGFRLVCSSPDLVT